MIRLNWQNFWLGYLVSLFIISRALPAYAQKYDKECVPEDTDKCTQPLLKGEVAPFSGQLLTPKLAIDLGQKAESFDIRLKLELEYVRKLYELDLKLEKNLRKLDNNSCTEKVNLLSDRLKDAKLDNWYQHPLFVATISVVLTTGLFIGGVYLFKAIDK